MRSQLYKKGEYIINGANGMIKQFNRIVMSILIIMLLCICSKEIIKNILITLGINDKNIIKISNSLHIIIKIFIQVFLVYLVVLIVFFLIKKIYTCIYLKNQKYRYSEMLKKEDVDQNMMDLYKNIYNYFSDKKDDIPIFISGEWGAGKTYTVNIFLEEYYKYSKQKIYKISCFGITTREVLMKRISEACENEDKSIFCQIVSLIGDIPILGEFLKNNLKKKYDINSIKSNSIFIFDNFERIEWTKYGRTMGHITTNYESAISKYDIVVGIIDELIEKYKMKVIIIGNEAEMVPDYLYDTFICKLGCKKYTIIPKAVVLENIWHEILDKIIIEKKSKKIFLDILDEVKITSEVIWKMSKKNNIRLVYKTIYNYISFMVNLMENNYEFDTNINEMTSLYYTNYIINLCNSYEIEKFNEYESIGLHYEKEFVRRKDTKYSCLSMINGMWCSNKELQVFWKNLEQNNYELRERLEVYKNNYKASYISRHNCTNSDLSIESIDFEDLLCLLTFAKEEFRNNAIKFLNKGIVKYSSLDQMAYTMDAYKAEILLENDDELMLCFFKFLRSNIEFNRQTEKLEKAHESFKRCNELYKRIAGNS